MAVLLFALSGPALANEPPVANDDFYTTYEDTPFSADLLSNDSDPDGDAIRMVGRSFNLNEGFPSDPEFDGSFTFRPAADFNGVAQIGYTIEDSHGVRDAAVAKIDVLPVNDAPSFTKGPDQTVYHSGAKSVPGWATNIKAGPANESNQKVSFSTSNDNEALFTDMGQPVIDSEGTLTFTPADGQVGSATVKVVAKDDGGTDGGGVDTSAELTFTIEVLEDQSLPELSISHTGANANGWNNTSPVTLNISAGDSGSGLAGDLTCKEGTTELPLTAGTAGNWTSSVSAEGTHVIECSVSDNAGNSASATDTVKIDTKAPSASCSVSPSRLRTSANNHKLVTITATVQVTDSSGGSGPNGFKLVSVASNQAQRGLGTGDVAGDIQGWTTGTADTSGQLRAERYGGARVYTLTYQGEDVAGNTSSNCLATVTVPKGG